MQLRALLSVSPVVLRSSFLFVLLLCTAQYFRHINPQRQTPLRPADDADLKVIGRRCEESEALPRSVAIIGMCSGAGSAGSSTAFYLKRFACNPLNITVFERSGYVGGRSHTVYVWDNATHPVELGASIFVNSSVNGILHSAVKEFNLPTAPAGGNGPPVSNLDLGIWDGYRFRFLQEYGTSFWWDTAKLLWKYGLSPIRTQRLMKQTVARFLELYEEPHFPFSSLSQAASDVGLISATTRSGVDFVKDHSISLQFAYDIIQASTRVNYAQNLDMIHGLETMVSMAAEGAVSVQDGNWRIFENFLRSSSAAVLLNSTVTKIAKDQESSKRVVSWKGTSRDDDVPEYQQAFDSVVVAAPFQFSGIWMSPDVAHVPDKIDYVRLYVTLFATHHTLSPYIFSLDRNSRPPNVILTTLPEGGADTNLPFFSISTLRELPPHPSHPEKPQYLYKIFSPGPLTPKFVAELLGYASSDTESPGQGNLRDTVPRQEISWIFEKVWHSYPYLPPRVTFEEPQLADNLWYTSGIESFISTMETSAFMGMNVAALISDSWSSVSPFRQKEDL